MADELLNPHHALIYVMVMTAAVDRDMADGELSHIGHMVKTLPVFEDFNANDLVDVAQNCQRHLLADDGLTKLLDIIVASLPAHLAETAYAIACEVATSDAEIDRTELEILALLRHNLRVDRLAAAAIERAVSVRHRKL